MQLIQNWMDLERFGVRLLTGEACAISARGLCDLSEDGAKLLKRFLALPEGCELERCQNPGAVASIMLPYSIHADFAAFACIEAGAPMAVLTSDGLHVPTVEESQSAAWGDWLVANAARIRRWYIPKNQPRAGLTCCRVF